MMLSLLQVYKLGDITKLVGHQSGLLVGAGAGPWPEVGVNCEMMANVNINGDWMDIKSKIAKVNPETKLGESHTISTDQFALMSNFYLSKGSRNGKASFCFVRFLLNGEEYIFDLHSLSHYGLEPGH